MARLSAWMTQVCNEMMRVNAAEAQLEMAVNMFLAEDGSCAVDSLAVRLFANRLPSPTLGLLCLAIHLSY